MTPLPVRYNEVFRSKLTFAIPRVVVAGVLLSSVPASIAGHERLVMVVPVVLSTMLAFGAVCWVLYRPKVVARGSEVVSVGYFRTRVIGRSEIGRFTAEPVWYSWRRMMVPCALILIMADGTKLRMPGVQSHLWNIGIVHNNIGVFLANSHPMAVASALNTYYACGGVSGWMRGILT